MPMFAFFPNSYAWTMACQVALGMGANINDIMRAIAPLQDISPTDPKAQDAWWTNWNAAGERLDNVAADYAAQGLWLAAQHSHIRASAIYSLAERMLPLDDARKNEAHTASIDALCASEAACARAGASHSFTYLYFPYGEHTLSGYLYKPANTAAPMPCAIALNGFDGTKELAYLSGFAEAMGARGIASFIIDQPGTGEALRRHNMPLEIESEHAAGAAYNFIANDPDIDAGRIAIVGQSLGGYYAPRAAAMDDRFAACIAWAGFYSMQLYYEQENPSADGLPGIMEYAFRAYGVANEKELVEKALKLTLVPVLDKIKVPFLCAHGGNDQQTGPLHATRAVAGAVNSPNAKAHIFTEDEGASEHCGVDNLALVNAYMADWLAQQFAPAA